MAEPWLRSNPRVVWLGCLVPLFVTCVAMLVSMAVREQGALSWLRFAGQCVAALGAACFVLSLVTLLTPRIARSDNDLLIYVRAGRPYRVPMDAVECFFLGQGPSGLPTQSLEAAETANVVVRLAESATDWREAPVSPWLAAWCDGYITIHGAWCERIDGDVVQHLNHRLVEAKRSMRNQPAAQEPSS